MSPCSQKKKSVLLKVFEHSPLTTLREKLVKNGAKVVRHCRYVMFQLAEVAVPSELFRKILRRIDDLRPRPAPAWAGEIDSQVKPTGGVCLKGRKSGLMALKMRAYPPEGCNEDAVSLAMGW
jgi:hypothetical protein